MKNHIILLLLSLLFLSCTQTVTEQLLKMPGEIVWQRGDVLIKNITDSIPKVVITGLSQDGLSDMTLYEQKADNERKELVLKGQVEKFGDLDKNGVPEFLIKFKTETTDTIYGEQIILAINNLTTLTGVKWAQININKTTCGRWVGTNENLAFDNQTSGGPYFAFISQNDINKSTGTNCDTYQQATTNKFYIYNPQEKPWNRLKQVRQPEECPISNQTINLSKLYALSSLSSYEQRNLTFNSNNKYGYYSITNNLSACGTDANTSALEDISGKKIFEGTATKRTDLMPYIEKEFTNVNPAFIKWARENLIPLPKMTQANGLTYQFIYQMAYVNKLRAMALLKLMITTHGTQELVGEYAQISKTMNFDKANQQIIIRDYQDISDYLYSKRNWMNELFEKSGYLGIQISAEDYGFYVRRMLDGSEPEIWQTMKYILKRYDNDWYQETFVNKKWTGLIEIDSATYFQNRLLSGVDSIILGKEAIPEGFATVNGAGITITCKNGKEVTFTNNNSEGESLAEYSLSGYWPHREMVIVDYSGWEWGNLILIDINTGIREDLEDGFHPSKGAEYLAESISVMEEEFVKLKLYKRAGNKWIETATYRLARSANDGFWAGNIFYLKQNSDFSSSYEKDSKRYYLQNYYKIGAINIDRIDENQEPIDTKMMEEQDTN